MSVKVRGQAVAPARVLAPEPVFLKRHLFKVGALGWAPASHWAGKGAEAREDH